MRESLNEQAADNLHYIRQAMERAHGVSSVSGLGGMAMGGVALLSTAIAAGLADLQQQLLAWLAAAAVAASVNTVAIWQKSRRHGDALSADPARRFMMCLAPSVAVAALLTWLLWSTGQNHLLPAIWMLLYGAGVLAAGTYAATPVMQTGACFLAAGAITLALPANLLNAALGISFGLIHIFFGWRIYQHHGG